MRSCPDTDIDQQGKGGEREKILASRGEFK